MVRERGARVMLLDGECPNRGRKESDEALRLTMGRGGRKNGGLGREILVVV